MDFTAQMAVSSVLNYVSSGFSWAAFIPSILRGYAWAEQELDAYFLAAWLVGDVLNMTALLLSGVPLPQQLLGIWYLIADTILLGEWLYYGSEHRFSPRGWRGPQNENMRQHRGKIGRRLTEAWEVFSGASDLKLCAFTVSLALALCGILNVLSLHADPNYSIEVPTTPDLLIEVLSFAAFALFTGARCVTLFKGWRAHFRGEKPQEDRFSTMFIILFAENGFQLASILVLSTETDYLLYEAPWIFGCCTPMLFDAIVITSANIWHNKWDKSPQGIEASKLDNQEKAEVGRLANMIEISRQKYRYKELLDERKDVDIEKLSKSELDRLNMRRGQIRKYKKQLIASPQQNAEQAWAHGPTGGLHAQSHHGSIEQFTKRVSAHYDDSAAEHSSSGASEDEGRALRKSNRDDSRSTRLKNHVKKLVPTRGNRAPARVENFPPSDESVI